MCRPPAAAGSDDRVDVSAKGWRVVKEAAGDLFLSILDPRDGRWDPGVAGKCGRCIVVDECGSTAGSRR
jgi:hypothetical protein